MSHFIEERRKDAVLALKEGEGRDGQAAAASAQGSVLTINDQGEQPMAGIKRTKPRPKMEVQPAPNGDAKLARLTQNIWDYQAEELMRRKRITRLHIADQVRDALDLYFKTNPVP